ncbi:MAG: B12-binding domain-containing radical SAM protein [Magnetococcus sp. THC-1_WYH]
MSQYRLLLIEPPFYRLYHDQCSLVRFPLALGYLAGAVLKETQWTVQTYNADFNITSSRNFDDDFMLKEGYYNYRRLLQDLSAPIWNEVATTIKKANPTVVGISAKTQNYASALLVARIVKQINPTIQIIFGGPHVTMVKEDVFKSPDIDLAVLGEGESTLVALLQCVEKMSDMASVAGIIFRRDGQLIRTPPRAFLTDLDALPFPADVAEQTLIHFAHYPKNAFRYIFATRGCPYTCTFCGSATMWSRKVRFRSVNNVVTEIRKLQNRGIGNVHFDDDTFGVKKSYLLDLCQTLEQKCPKLMFSCETSIHLIDQENVTAIQRAGCVIMLLGVESGDDRMLKEIRKNITMAQIVAAIAILRKYGGPYLRIHTFFMVGFPEETEATMQATMAAMTRIGADRILLSVFTPYPGSELFERCRELKLIGADFDHSRFNHQSPENCFTAHIPPQQFRALVAKASQIAAKQNQSTRWHPIQLLWRRVLWSIRQRGVIGTAIQFLKG